MSYGIGSRIGDYEILDILGAGGMGQVYKVRNTISDRVEAMKVLLPDLKNNPGFADRFMREIKVQASMEHPNIAALYTALRVDNQILMLMEYVEGITLEKAMEAGRIPIDTALDYITQVLSALAYAHTRGVIHRDVKPANMMVATGGGMKLMDFGIAKASTDFRLTHTGSVVGSPYYIPPERLRGTSDLDPRSDLYSLGVTLYEVVTGQLPFQGDSIETIVTAHLQKKPPPPIQISPDLPPGLSEIILKALEKEPSERFQTAEDFRRALLSVSKPVQGAVTVPSSAKKGQSTPRVDMEPWASERISQSQQRIQPQIPTPMHGRRAFWIALGVLIAIAVIVSATTLIPRFRHTAAENVPAKETRDTGTDYVPKAPDSVPIQTIPAESPDLVTTPPNNVATPSTETTLSADVQTPSSGTSSPRTSPAPGKQPTVSAPMTSKSPRTELARPIPSPPVPAEDSRRTEQLNSIQEKLERLSVRAKTAKNSLEILRKQLEAEGLGLRADMMNSALQMELFIGKTEAALSRRDVESANNNLDLAEGEVAKLEKLQGR